MLRYVTCNLLKQKGKLLHKCASCNADIHYRCGKIVVSVGKKLVMCQKCLLNNSSFVKVKNSGKGKGAKQTARTPTYSTNAVVGKRGRAWYSLL